MEKGRFSSVVERMAYRYNQLYLTPKKGISETGMYYDIVRYGKIPPEMDEARKKEGLSGFKCSERDRYFSETTPAGKVDIVYLHERCDFERFLQIMVYSGEPANVASRIESAEILGVTNWRKIEDHMNEYLSRGGEKSSWRDELRRFTNNKQNYQDSIILLGNSGYSGLSADDTGFGDIIWEEVSLKIKIYSSCARFICRRLFSEYKNIIWEEILADCIGILFAFNKYDTLLAKKLLGITKKGYDKKSRFMNFCIDLGYDAEVLAMRITDVIDRLDVQIKKLISSGITDYYDVLFRLEEDMEAYVDILKGHSPKEAR